MVANIFPQTPLLHDTRDGVKWSKSMVMLHIKLNEIINAQHGSKFLPTDPLTLGGWVEKEKSQLLQNHEFNNMTANILHAYPLSS